MKIKILLGSIAAVIVLALIAGSVWWELRPQVIPFDDDSKVTLMKVDYGKHHKVDATHHELTTTNDALVIWVHEQYPDANSWHGFQYYLYDKANTACVMGTQAGGGNGRRGNQIIPIQFPAFPRGDSKFYVAIQENSNDGQEISDQKFAISNPARSSSDKWASQPLPDTEEDGDLSVTLKKLVAGAKMPYNRNGDAGDDPINQGVQATFDVQMNGTNADNWQPVAVTTSDATSNSVAAFNVNSQVQSNDLVSTFQYGLWPNVPAWKMRVEFSKQTGFDDTELWSVPNLPLQDGLMRDFFGGRARGKKPAQAQAQPAVVATPVETDLQGLHITIQPPKRFTDMQPNSQPQGGLVIQIAPALPAGMRLTLVKLTDDQGNDIQHWDYGNNTGRNGGQYRYGLQNVDGVTNINVTLAVHKSHYVEFTAKPEMAPKDTSDQSDQSN